MDQMDLVKRFNDDLDSILTGKPQTNSNQNKTEYGDLLNLAAVLAQTDSSPDNGRQQILRRQLVNRCRENDTAGNKKEAFMNIFSGKHRLALVACSLALAALIGVNLILPGSFSAMAKEIGTILKIGPYVTLIDSSTTAPDPASVDPLTPEQRQQLDKNGYVQYTADDGSLISISSWGRPPVDTVNYASLLDAQNGVSFELQSPEYLPQGYSFKNAECYKGSKEYMTMRFQGPGKDIVLMLRLMNENTKYESGGKLEPVMINGNNGAWVDSELVWDKDGVNYTLFANDLSKDEIRKIAESIK